MRHGVAETSDGKEMLVWNNGCEGCAVVRTVVLITPYRVWALGGNNGTGLESWESYKPKEKQDECY